MQLIDTSLFAVSDIMYIFKLQSDISTSRLTCRINHIYINSEHTILTRVLSLDEFAFVDYMSFMSSGVHM